MGIPEPKVRQPEQEHVPVAEKDVLRSAQQTDAREHTQNEPQDEQQQQPEREPEIDRYGNEIIDMSGPVEPEPPHKDAPPLEPDNYVPDRSFEPDHYPDFEMGD